MKKAKLMLAAVVVLSIVGGALAFKAKNPGLYCSAGNSPTGVCNNLTTGIKIDPSGTPKDQYCTTASDLTTTCDPVSTISE